MDVCKNLGSLILLFLTGCSSFRTASENAASRKNWNDKVRMAEAPMTSSIDTRVQGLVTFEQMPNSVIVTFHLEGLAPKSNYKMFLSPNQNCDKINLATAQLMTPVRTGEAGIAENTLKLPDLKVSSLAGDIVVLWPSATPPLKKQAVLQIAACGSLRPQAPTAAKPSTEGSEL